MSLFVDEKKVKAEVKAEVVKELRRELLDSVRTELKRGFKTHQNEMEKIVEEWSPEPEEETTDWIPQEPVTPKGDLSWYLKWAATIIGTIGLILTSIAWTPVNLWFTAVAITLWLTVGILWKDRAFIVANTVSLTVLVLGIVAFYFGVNIPEMFNLSK